MIASPLPDRDRRHLLQFYLAPKMDYGIRLVWAGGLILVGLALQLLVPLDYVAVMLMISLPFLLAGNALLLVRGYNLKPRYALHSGQWEKTTRDRFAKMRAMENAVKRWDETWTDVTCTLGVVGVALVAGAVFIVLIVLQSSPLTRGWAPVFLADAAVLFIPHWITGTRRGWRPVALRQQIETLEIALAAIEPFESPPCQVQPMFEMAGTGERRVPISARVFIRFPDGPEEFLGVQYQVALNDVQGTKFPYLYAVVVAKKEFGLLERHMPEIRRLLTSPEKRKSGFRSLFDWSQKSGLTIESSREGEVEVIVIRQHTTKKSGYHTDPAAVRRIARSAWHSAEHILATAPAVTV